MTDTTSTRKKNLLKTTLTVDCSVSDDNRFFCTINGVEKEVPLDIFLRVYYSFSGDRHFTNLIDAYIRLCFTKFGIDKTAIGSKMDLEDLSELYFKFDD